jgi:predicted nucleic acid-binding protein
LSSNVRVVNTAPLIFLSKLGKLELLQLGAKVVYAPVTVLKELGAVEDEATTSVQGMLGTWLLEKSCTQHNLIALAPQALDPGESVSVHPVWV